MAEEAQQWKVKATRELADSILTRTIFVARELPPPKDEDNGRPPDDDGGSRGHLDLCDRDAVELPLGGMDLLRERCDQDWAACMDALNGVDVDEVGP